MTTAALTSTTPAPTITCPPWHADCWTEYDLGDGAPVRVHHHGPAVALLTADAGATVGVRWQQIDGRQAGCVVDVGPWAADLNAEELAQVAAGLVLAWARLIDPSADQAATLDAVLASLRAEALDVLADQKRGEADNYGRADAAA